MVDRLNDGGIQVVIATGQLIGEGFDCPNLTTLFLATPVSFSGRVLQYVGRVLRPAPGKSHARIFDYIDVNVEPLVKAARARQRVYGPEISLSSACIVSIPTKKLSAGLIWAIVVGTTGKRTPLCGMVALICIRIR